MPTGQLGARVVGFAVGQLVGDKAVIVAKGILWVFARPWLQDGRRVAEGSLLVILGVALVSAVLGGWLAVRKKWEYADALLVGTVVGVVTAVFVIVDYGVEGSVQRAGQAAYFLWWVVGLWLLPAMLLLLLPNRGWAGDRKVLVGYGMLAVAAAMTGIGLASGFVVELVVGCMGRWLAPDLGIDWGSVEKLWVSRPVSMNAIFGSLIIVACAPMWWRGLEWSRRRTWVWLCAFTVGAAAHAGLWGAYLYRAGRHGGWELADNFGMLPVVGVLGVLLVYAVTREETKACCVGWAVSKRLWWPLLLGAFGVICAAYAVSCLAPIEQQYEGQRRWVLGVMHGLNGVAIGMGVVATKGVFWLVPEEATSHTLSRSRNL